MKRRLILLSIVISFSIPVLAQTIKVADDDDDERKERIATLVDRIQTDSTGLGLAENRSYAAARTGALVCGTDKKLAAALFQSAISELVNAQAMAEAEAKGRPNRSGVEIRISQAIRPIVLTAIAACDAGYALESFYRTRTPAIQRALAAVTSGAKPSDTTAIDSSYVRSELALEQQLTVLAATQNPELAIKLLQDSIRKGLSTQTLGLLKKLFERDADAGNSLAAEVLDKLSSSNFSNDPEDAGNVNLALAILNDYIRPKKPNAKEMKFDDLAIRSLAQKLVSFSLIPSPFNGMQRLPAVIAIAEKLAPGSVAALKKLQKSGMPRNMSSYYDSDARKILTGNATPEQMLSDAKALSADARPMVYEAAAGKLAIAGDLNKAIDLIRANFTGTALDNALARVNAAFAVYLARQGKFAEADRVIDDLPETNRFSSQLFLANTAFTKDKVENKAFAISVLRKARGLISDRPGNDFELSQIAQLVMTSAPIEPDEAFAMFEPIIPTLNELNDANAVVWGFQNNFNVRSGEFEMAITNSYGFRLDPAVIRALAKADFDRTLKLIDAFSRREMRITLRLQLAETGLK